MRNFTKSALSFFVFAGISVTAQTKGDFIPRHLQHPCGIVQYESHLKEKRPQIRSRANFEEWLAPKVAEQKLKRTQSRGVNQIVTLPIVVHLLHNGPDLGVRENITMQQVQSQITALNQYFRKMVNTQGYNTDPAGADLEIEFCLAQTDPNGLYTTGLIRHYVDGGVMGYEQIDILKAETQWDPEQYINIWIVHSIMFPDGSETLGFAYYPEQSGLDGINDELGELDAIDGLVITHNTFGSENVFQDGTYKSNYKKGITAAHEMGHFLGLIHVWGDADDCTTDDFCEDTPLAYSANFYCPDEVDSCPSESGNDMIANYMDYTYDVCKNTFTNDQKDRVMAVLENSPRRVGLKTSGTCQAGTRHPVEASLDFFKIENVGCSSVNLATKVLLTNTGSDLITSAIINYTINGGQNIELLWNGNLAPDQEIVVPLDTQQPGAGQHLLSISLGAVNGVADPAPANDSRSRNFIIQAPENFDTEVVVLTVQRDWYTSETSWQVIDAQGAIVASGEPYPDPEEFPAPETFAIPVVSGNCYEFIINDAFGDGICCLWGNGNFAITTQSGDLIANGGNFGYVKRVPFGINYSMSTEKQVFEDLRLFPNPAGDTLELTLGESGKMPHSYAIYNQLGQLVLGASIDGRHTRINIESLSGGVYLIKVNADYGATTLPFIVR